MARKKKTPVSKEPEKPGVVLAFPPTGAADNPLPKGQLTKDTLVDYQENLLVFNARTVLPRLFKSLKQRLESLDPKAAQQVMELYGYTKANPGVVINNMLQSNTFQADDNSVYFEKIIRTLENRDRPQGSHSTSDDVIDAEVVS